MKKNKSNASGEGLPGHEQIRLAEVMERRRFHGWSGTARAVGGLLALGTAAALHVVNPQNPVRHADAWGLLALACFLIYTGAMLKWFFTDPDCQRDASRLVPLMDAALPFLVCCALSITMIMSLHFGYLFGTWLLFYGLIHLAVRHVMPSGMRLVGLYYVLCGLFMMLVFRVPFDHPWPMGLVLFVGEIWGGLLLLRSRSNGGLQVTLKMNPAR